MAAVSELIDAAKKVCLSDAEVARRIGVTRSLIAQWRSGRVPIPQERIVQIAKIAGENSGFWLAKVEADQSHGDTRKAWERVAAALPRVAVVAMVLGTCFAHFPVAAQKTEPGSLINIMRSNGRGSHHHPKPLSGRVHRRDFRLFQVETLRFQADNFVFW